MSVISDDIPVPGFAGEVPPANYDEAKIPAYTLPDPLEMADGRTVASAETWEKERRPEILDLFAKNMYGKTPTGCSTGFSYETTSEGEALGGKATRREVRLYADTEKEKPLFDILIYFPKNAGESDRVPVALCLNFNGNHTISTDPGITLGTDWVDSKKGDRRLVPRLASDADRGNARSRWPLETIIDHGYALVTAYYCQIEPDFDGGIAFGVRRGMPRPKADEWGAIGAWAIAGCRSTPKGSWWCGSSARCGERKMRRRRPMTAKRCASDPERITLTWGSSSTKRWWSPYPFSGSTPRGSATRIC